MSQSQLTTMTVLRFLVDAYPAMEISPGTLAIYVQVLSDIPPEQLKIAVLRHVTQSRFFPSVSELREAAAGLHQEAEDQPDAYTAWAEVTAAFRDVGYYRQPTWSHPLIGRAVDALGGWRNLCQSENGVADRARFFEVYGAYASRSQNERTALPVVQTYIAQLRERLSANRLPSGDEVQH